MATLTAVPVSGEVVHPGRHETTHSLAIALRRMSDEMLDNPSRPIHDGELFDAASSGYPWIPVQSRQRAA
jgi:hypothetical protein